MHTGVARYLFVRRPSTGLLANQWEFPSIEVPQAGAGVGVKGVKGVKGVGVKVGVGSSTGKRGTEEEEAYADTDIGILSMSDDLLLAPFPDYFQSKLGIDWFGDSGSTYTK
jgi:hypothetical protein